MGCDGVALVNVSVVGEAQIGVVHWARAVSALPTRASKESEANGSKLRIVFIEISKAAARSRAGFHTM